MKKIAETNPQLAVGIQMFNQVDGLLKEAGIDI